MSKVNVSLTKRQAELLIDAVGRTNMRGSKRDFDVLERAEFKIRKALSYDLTRKTKQKEVRLYDCRKSGWHLWHYDKNGYCNNCGRQ
jgi:hypothetical protein